MRQASTVFLFLFLAGLAQSQTYSFRDGVNGYNSSIDTELTVSSPNSDNRNKEWIFVDWPSTSSIFPFQHGSQVLIRFDDIFGTGPGQIPAGRPIQSAFLRLRTVNSGHGGRLHRMIQPWAASASWNSMLNGVQPNGVEARSTATAEIGDSSLSSLVQRDTVITLDVTSDLVAWSTGQSNRGWAILPYVNGINGLGFYSDTVADVSRRPELVVTVVPEPGTMIALGLGAAAFVRRRKRLLSASH